jgi:hypothetical protein
MILLLPIHQRWNDVAGFNERRSIFGNIFLNYYSNARTFNGRTMGEVSATCSRQRTAAQRLGTGLERLLRDCGNCCQRKTALAVVTNYNNVAS